MPRHRPPTTGYARIAQADEESGYLDDSDEDETRNLSRTISASNPRYGPIQPTPHGQMYAGRDDSPPGRPRRGSVGRRRPRRSSSGVDIKAINARLERWAGEIASKFKIHKVRGKTDEEEQLEIQHSVFQAPEGVRPASVETLDADYVTDNQEDRMTKIGFDDIVESVRVAIELGVHPKMISQGSSGSYFARNSDGKVVGVFKPKDEEPYATRNPKWTKWIHRNLFPCFFGRECLIPNLSYVSEAASYVLDSRLRTNLVPYTDIVYLSSKSFHYDFWERSNYYRKRKPLPAKVGSFQVFLKGFKDANIFLRDHPWPDQAISGFRPEDPARKKKRPWAETCRPGATMSDDDEDDVPSEARSSTNEEEMRGKFVWTESLQQSFREELEKLVILDYIMRNTDRGLDNWMIRVDSHSQEVSIISEPPSINGSTHNRNISTTARGQDASTKGPNNTPYKRQENMTASSRSQSTPESSKIPAISIGAIDNSLSWPWKHPDAWRSFPFGWLFLPVSLIGQPFSQKTRDHFLPLLTSTHWWSETQMALRRIFSQDSDFQETMFAKQIAVMKGQAWNVVETLKTSDHGPLELTRRTRVCVFDDLVDIPVAIPMRTPSAEMRHRRDVVQRRSIEEEEMDISAANASAPQPQHDLLGLSVPAADLPNPNRFDLSRTNSMTELDQRVPGPQTPATTEGVTFDHDIEVSEAKKQLVDSISRPTNTRSKTRSSFEGHRKQASTGSQRRRYSFTGRHGNHPFMYDVDDLEGDLGYAAAEGMEGHQRKVIVERLVTVKSKHPVFTWCQMNSYFGGNGTYGQDTPRTPRPDSTNHVSASMLLDPKSMKSQAAEGRGEHLLESKVPSQSGTTPHISNVSPRQLLDPKRFQQNPKTSSKSPSRPSSPHDTMAATSPELLKVNQPYQPPENLPEPQGLGGMIERIHNVTQRQERPQKRQKTDCEDANDKVAFTGGGKNGEIGEYLKQKRKEGQEEAEVAASTSVVDLTGGDDEEDLVMISDSQDKEVCYGRIEKTKVNAHQIPDPGIKANYLSKSEWPTMKLQFKRFPGNDNIIRVLDPSGKDFGNVDVKTSLGLAPLLDSKNPKYSAQARLMARKRKLDSPSPQYPSAPCSEYLDLIVNLYGPKSKAEAIGKFLKTKSLKFLTPFSVDSGKEICNPHAPTTTRSDNLPRTSYHAPTAGFVTRTTEEIRSDVLGMFDNLQQSETLPEMEAQALIITPLLTHQKQALYFMVSKEQERVFGDNEEDNNSLWRLRILPNGQRTYYNVITGQEEHQKPPESLGGILADMMGLGKTLSILSLIVHGLSDAQTFGVQTAPIVEEDDVSLIRNSKATLLVCPLSTVANWEEQVKTHIEPGKLSYYIYHGSNRNKNINMLASFDVVITTYAIVSSEYFGRGGSRGDGSPLFQTNFFRIVLDEAHSIREQATRQSQAICALSAQRRWAVTGTPVQNRLDDLGALIKFLRIKPFSERGGFSQFILSPFKMADPEVLPKLRLLVDSITLRRLKDRIDLPDRTDQIVRLKFTPDEERLYEWFARDSDRRVRILANEQRKSLGGKSYVHILRAIMRLRLICAHGRELLSEDDLKLTEGYSANNAIDLDSDDIDSSKLFINAREAYQMLMLFRETDADTCCQCAKKIEPDLEVAGPDQDQVIGHMLPCYQVVCEECFPGLKKHLDMEKTHFTCPYCDSEIRTSFFELTKIGIEAAEAARERAKEDPKHAKIMGRYGGPHTKTKALLDALEQSKIDSEELPTGEHPIKSVVFSGWTSHLDLIQIALEEHRIRYVRLDGKMARKQRAASLDAFRDDPNVTVILISIGAGGLGLNLTTGSKVYMMEPQFNPAAEAQAVDRVHRLGQTREVTITRFIMEGSFEEKMLALQKKKQNLADLSMNRGKLDKAEAAKQRLDELRSLFK
ncbi:MAG: hypothetical protein Q9221_007459 [Calogaya cf. arnoldii]